MQLSLLDQLPSQPDRDFRHARRQELGGGAWVEYVPDWLYGHHQALDLLTATSNWERHRRVMYDRIVEVPRLVAAAPGSAQEFAWNDGEVIQARSSANSQDVEEASDLLAGLAAHLSLRYRRVLDSVTLAHYRHGRDSVAFHGDKMGKLRSDTVVAIVSVGARRNFLLRPAAASGLPRRTVSFHFGGGDLLVMGGTCQETWEHGVPKMASAGSRIAIMFRETLPEPRAAVSNSTLKRPDFPDALRQRRSG